jgi:hypothetical protein
MIFLISLARAIRCVDQQCKVFGWVQCVSQALAFPPGHVPASLETDTASATAYKITGLFSLTLENIKAA